LTDVYLLLQPSLLQLELLFLEKEKEKEKMKENTIKKWRIMTVSKKKLPIRQN